MKILLGVTGSIAAIKVLDLVHRLTQLNYQCRVIVTKDGLNFVTPLSLSSMGADVYMDDALPSYKYNDVMEHINLAKWADCIIIVPTTANTLAKVASGMADNLLTSTIMAYDSRIFFVPAMNQAMWNNPLTQINITKLNNLGHIFWGPSSGVQACGDNGSGRMIEVDEILLNINNQLKINTVLNGKKIVITGGSTIEPIDPVRYIGNRSSGKMANALVMTAHNFGLKVIYICGKTDQEPPIPSNVTIIKVETADEMYTAAIRESETADIFIGCAAVCDYKPKEISSQKIKKQSESIILELVQNEDIIKSVKQRYPNLLVVGFAAETENLISYAIIKLQAKNLDMIIANDISCGVFGNENNQATIIKKDLSQTKLPTMSKIKLAEVIMKLLTKMDHF